MKPRRSVVLVSCVKTKRSGKCRAQELYTSGWFKLARSYAEKHADLWWILSAKHHVLAPTKVVGRYEATLNRMNALQRRDWAARVSNQLQGLCRQGDQVVLLAGRRYYEHLLANLKKRGCSVKLPLKHLGRGRQMEWLKART
jgi:hypothetical protein